MHQVQNCGVLLLIHFLKGSTLHRLRSQTEQRLATRVQEKLATTNCRLPAKPPLMVCPCHLCALSLHGSHQPLTVAPNRNLNYAQAPANVVNTVPDSVCNILWWCGVPVSFLREPFLNRGAGIRTSPFHSARIRPLISCT